MLVCGPVAAAGPKLRAAPPGARAGSSDPPVWGVSAAASGSVESLCSPEVVDGPGPVVPGDALDEVRDFIVVDRGGQGTNLEEFVLDETILVVVDAGDPG